ncbi:MAG: LCP family protein [Anaerolineae bacterium]|nr:LCP family protein [Anaerolineae bacterium]
MTDDIFTDTTPHTDIVPPDNSTGEIFQPPSEPVVPESELPALELRAPSSPVPSHSSGHWYSLAGQSPLDHARTRTGTASRPRYRAGQHSARDRVRKRKLRRQQGLPAQWVSAIIASAMVGVVGVVLVMAFFLVRAANVTGSTVATSIPQQPTSVFYGAEGGLLGEQSMVINPWKGEDRFTVLVMGVDRRPGEAGTAFLTDTIILISLDPATDRVGILSLPRDLQVEVPDFGVQPINTVYRLGELDGIGGGSHLAVLTVQYNLGIPVNEYVVVDFNAFIRIVDEIGGIDVEVKQTVDDPEYPDMNYGYSPFYLEAGWQHLDGETALKFARSRHQTDDIDRAYRQQQVLYAVRDRVISKDMLPTLAAKAYTLWADLRDSIDTGLSVDQMLQLAWSMKDVPRQNIKSGVLDWNYIIAENWNGRPIIRPDRTKIADLMIEVFGPDYNTASSAG